MVGEGVRSAQTPDLARWAGLGELAQVASVPVAAAVVQGALVEVVTENRYISTKNSNRG